MDFLYSIVQLHFTICIQKGHDHIEAVARKILPGLDTGRAIAAFAGVRANIDNVPKEEKDFVVRLSAPHFVSALGIKNPGMTASPYLVNMIIDILKEDGLVCEAAPDFQPVHRFRVPFLKAGRTEQKRMLAEDPAYGRVVCKCEGITEGDIKAALGGALPPHNINGLKKRLRVSMGRCQGSFCIPEVIDILSREWGEPAEKILKGEPGSNFVKGRLR